MFVFTAAVAAGHCSMLAAGLVLDHKEDIDRTLAALTAVRCVRNCRNSPGVGLGSRRKDFGYYRGQTLCLFRVMRIMVRGIGNMVKYVVEFWEQYFLVMGDRSIYINKG